MHVLVIGGSGFIGSHIADELIRDGHKVKIFSKDIEPEVKTWLSSCQIVLGDLYSISDEDYLDVLRDIDAIIFAAGVDDRKLPRKPAFTYFSKGNVEPAVRLVKLAKQISIKKFLFIGSYFTFFNEQYPDLELAEVHPYIRSRVEQKAQVFKLLDAADQAIFLELPFVFGKVVGGRSLWAPLVWYLGSWIPVYAPPGGTAIVSVKEVARVTLKIIKDNNGLNSMQISQVNMTFEELFLNLSSVLGKKRNIHKLPRWLFDLFLKLVYLLHWIRGREGGLNFAKLSLLLSKKLYLSTDYKGAILSDQTGEVLASFADTL